MEPLLLSVLLAVGLGLLVAIELRERPAGPVQTVELRFGTDLTESVATALIGAIAGLPSRAAVALDVVADHEGIRHFLRADQATLDALSGSWRGMLPSLRIEPVEAPLPEVWSCGAVMRPSETAVLRRDAVVESAAALLGVLGPLGTSEVVLLRAMLRPGSRPRSVEPVRQRRQRHGESLLAALVQESGVAADHARALRLKYAGPIVEGALVVAARAGHPKRAVHLVSRVVSVVRARRGSYGSLAARRARGPRVARLLRRRRLRGGRFAPLELAGILGLPVAAPQVPGLVLGTSPMLLPSPRIPTKGRVLAESTWPGRMRPLAQPIIGAMSHTLALGPTGVGKSALVANLVVQDLAAGRGLLVLDGKGDLVGDILSRIPAGREDDVIVLDPGRGGALPGLRLFGRGADRELIAELVLGIFAGLNPSTWGPLSSKWLRAGLIAVAHDPQGTLADLPFVFSDDAYRRRLVARIDDVLLKNAFAALDAMSPQERAHQISAPLGKVEEIIGRRIVRGVVGQSDPKLDMGEVLRSGKVVLVALSPGQIGAPAARLLGALLTYKFFEAIQARSALPTAKRTPFVGYIDEPRVLGDVPVPIDSIFELARGLSVGLVVGAQSLGQLPAQVRAAALTNAATWIAFRQSSADAQVLARELPGVAPEALQHLAAFEVVARIGLGPGDVAPPASARTYPPSPPTSDPDVVWARSAERYGTDPAEVDAALAARHERPAAETPVGRARRSS
jgi:hypothetical protein